MVFAVVYLLTVSPTAVKGKRAILSEMYVLAHMVE
jgi:hypothetical protein